MLKLPKGLKKKKKKSKKDQELFTEEELEQYKRDLKAKQEAAAIKSDAGESDGAASDVDCSTSGTAAQHRHQHQHQHQPVASTSGSGSGSATGTGAGGPEQATGDQADNSGANDEEWAKFKALTSGVDSILHKTQDELDRIKKESFYQRLPSAAEKKKQEEEEAARREAERLEQERQRLAQIEAQRDKLAEAVVQLSESEDDAGDDDEVDDIFATDYIEAITSGELQLAVVPDSPILQPDDGPDPFDTAYAEKVIVGADRSKGNKKLVSLGAAVEVLSGRVDRDHAVALANPKRKLRKGIQNLLLSESVEVADPEADLLVAEPQHNLLDDLDEELPESAAPIDLSVSLHLHLLKPKEQDEAGEQGEEEELGLGPIPDLSEFDALKDEEDDEFAELAAESLTKKEEVTIVSQVILPPAELPTEAFAEASWAEFEPEPEPETGKPKRPPPPVRPATGPHIVPGAIYVSDDEEENPDDDPFNTNYAEQVIKKTTVLEEDDDFDPRADEDASFGAGASLAAPARDLLAGSATDLSQVVPAPLAPTLSVDQEPEDFDPFDTSAVSALVQPKATELRFLERELLNESGGGLKHSLSDPDFDPRADQDDPPPVVEPAKVKVDQIQPEPEFDAARRKSSLSLNIQAKSVGFLVPAPDLLGAGNEVGANKKPLTPYYAPVSKSIEEKDPEDVDPFDTSYVPEAKLSDIELKHIENDLIKESSTLRHSLSDPDFDPRAPPTPVPAEVLLAVEENIDIKVLTPAQERKKLTNSAGGGAGDSEEDIDPFDTSIAANLRPGETELKLLENELLPETKTTVTDVLDVLSDAQELGLGDKVLTPSTHDGKPALPAPEIDPFDTSIAENLGPGETEIKLLESELIER
ncbi:protein stoned-A [Drosophila bipectinata]|uniref:protein stoned-A n=1 Tax=Drosophila bipectinata TaxID=42026 RepID=UPI001C88F2D1|nr:protein stoned-A [Drosophila bipectinata]XP_017100615.2 protein stoned-A [Drosophila bipectinata]XP_043066136.1 protein stoned-A [Drosophila bipectinata]XP_043066137.1 protein stoned-A [Drosophila bipectinata]XP_043066138.1 protein stoned-A [Drosophila bipectinata]